LSLLSLYIVFLSVVTVSFAPLLFFILPPRTVIPSNLQWPLCPGRTALCFLFVLPSSVFLRRIYSVVSIEQAAPRSWPFCLPLPLKIVPSLFRRCFLGTDYALTIRDTLLNFQRSHPSRSREKGVAVSPSIPYGAALSAKRPFGRFPSLPFFYPLRRARHGFCVDSQSLLFSIPPSFC